MPLRVSEAADGLVVVLKCSGDVTGHDFVRATREVMDWESDRLARLVGGFVDHSGSDGFTVENPEIAILVSLDMRLAETVRKDFLVSVAAPNDIQFGVSRMWQASAARTSWEIHVDRDAQNAIAWLRDRARLKFGIDVPAFNVS